MYCSSLGVWNERLSIAGVPKVFAGKMREGDFSVESSGDSRWLVALQRRVPGLGSIGKIFLHVMTKTWALGPEQIARSPFHLENCR